MNIHRVERQSSGTQRQNSNTTRSTQTGKKILVISLVLFFLGGGCIIRDQAKDNRPTAPTPLTEREFVLNANLTALSKPTHEAVVTTSEYENFRMATAVVDARKIGSDGQPHGRTIVWPESYDSRLDKFEIQRLQIFAEALNARFVAIEMPGIGISKSTKMPLIDNFNLLRGNLDKIGLAMQSAAQQALGLRGGDSVEYLLYSQGVPKGVAMMKSAHGLHIDRIMIIESVNDQSRSLIKLFRAIQAENSYTDMYLANNKQEWMVPPDAKSISKKTTRLKLTQLVPALTAGLALRMGYMPNLTKLATEDKINHLTGISDARVDFYKFNDSAVSILNDNRTSVNELQSAMGSGTVNLTIIKNAGNVPSRHTEIHDWFYVNAIATKLLN